MTTYLPAKQSQSICKAKCRQSNYFILYHDMGSVEISNEITIIFGQIDDDVTATKYMEPNKCRKESDVLLG